MTSYIKLLNDSRPNEIGTKAKNLKILHKNGFNIPNSIIITTDFLAILLKYNNINSPIKYNWNKVKFPLTFESNLLKIIDQKFKDKPLVIRSSATCEDSPLLSFAGQYSSFLNIKGEKKILKAIRLCYGSLYSKNALLYAKYRNINIEKERMAIIIQEVADISISGIMFTANPIEVDTKEIIIEYLSGLGDKIAGGITTPKTIRIKDLNKINQKLIKNVASIGGRIEKIFSFPQDIEWGYGHGKYYIFQSRPITTLKIENNYIKPPQNITKLAKGIRVCGGSCIGALKIIRKISDYERIANGDIVMILTKPDIKLAEKIKKINGMIIPGGLLSHFAVISREFNKPCIAQISNFVVKNSADKKYYLNATKGELSIINK